MSETRKIFYVDVGDLSEDKALAYINKVREQLKKSKGKVDQCENFIYRESE